MILICCCFNIALLSILLVELCQDPKFMTCNTVPEGKPTFPNSYILGMAVTSIFLAHLSKQTWRMAMLQQEVVGTTQLITSGATIALCCFLMSVSWLTAALSPQFWTGACIVGMPNLDGTGHPTQSQVIATTLSCTWFAHSIDCLLWTWLHVCPGPRYAAVLQHLKDEQGIKFNNIYANARKFMTAVIPRAFITFAVLTIQSIGSSHDYNKDNINLSQSWISVMLYTEFIHSLESMVNTSHTFFV